MLIAQLLATVLSAAAAPDATFTGNATLFVVAVAVPVLGLAVTALNLFLGNKRNPPVGEEMHKTFVPRAEWDSSVQRLHGRIDESNERITSTESSTSAKIDSLRTDMTKVFHDVERALGRVEGQLDEKKSNK